MNILSLFDGMSCGQIALDQLGIHVDNYYASEIDKYAMQITQKNYPRTIQLGDITKWREWDIDWESIDLVFGGSPCQGFSFAGKQLAFNDPRSKLFFVFVDIVNHIREANPNVKFLLENVRMKQENLDVITKYMDVQPVKINSALVSAQNRVRYYWTNITKIEHPRDRGIFLKDIIEGIDVDADKARTIDANYFKGGKIGGTHQSSKRNYCIQVALADLKGHDSIKRVYSVDGKSPALTTMGGGHREPKILDTISTWRKLTVLECERLQTVPEGYTEGVSNTQRYRMLGNGWTIEVIKHIFKSL